MNGETRILHPDLPDIAPVVEKQPAAEQKIAAANDSRNVPTAANSTKLDDRFARLKRHLRKRSASIL